ncbi:hypothetical protein ACP86_06010 [Marinobacter sp. CP1]|jgi:hypothetical protein|nr:hypothetical protein ACP86_06010 [Marinobacter sp. CP1]
MGRWLDRVKQTTPSNDRAGSDTTQAGGMVEPTEPTKAPSVGFVGCVSGGTPKTKTIYRELIQACRGLRLLPSELKAGLDNDDLRDIGAGAINREHLRAYARFLAENGHFVRLDRKTDVPNRDDAKERPRPLDSPALRPARDRFYGHIPGCSICNPNRGRYCRDAWELREQYREPECTPDRRKAREWTANHLKTCRECQPHVSRFCQIGQNWLETYSLTKLQIGPAYLPPPASNRVVLSITLKGWRPTSEMDRDSAM